MLRIDLEMILAIISASMLWLCVLWLGCSTADDVNPATPNICYAAMIPRVLIYEAMQDL